MDGGLRITVAHELVHTLFHDRFLKLLQLLGEEKVDLHSSTETFTLDENMTDIQKAICIAEWQADVLAMRLVIPSDTVITDIDAAVHTHYVNSGDRMQACVIIFAKIYGVSCYVAKERLRQLGYDNVDGTFIIVDGCMYQPFSFPRGTLKENETFIINRANYKRLLLEDKDFADLVESRFFIYTGYVICINDVKYISPVSNDNGLSFELSEYARNHVNECCIKFTWHEKQCATTYTEFDYLNKLADGTYSKDGELTQEAKNDWDSYKRMKNDEKKAKKILVEMDEANVKSFAEALHFHIKRLRLRPVDIYDEKYLKESTFLSYYKGSRNPTLENVLIICNKLGLPYKLCTDLLKKLESH